MSSTAHSALHPTSSEAVQIGNLWWIMLAVGGAVWIAVIVAMLWSAWRGRRAHDVAHTHGEGESGSRDEVLIPSPAREKVLKNVVGGLTAATAVTLLIFLGFDFRTARAIMPPPGADIEIDVTAHQWWWEFTYDKSDPVRQLVTASELHVPVGANVRLNLRTADVIHSIWFPNMQGKRDMIPGHDNVLHFRADTIGTYLGECAEFCGMQHAKMRIVLVAESRAAYDQWLARQRSPSVPPSSEQAMLGQQVFLNRSCATCHAIRGTPAGGRVAPDLTHAASRSMIASAAVPNTPDNLRRWILFPDSIKPGTHMPSTQLPEAELRTLLVYLETLR